jgi:hypothetical protein
MERVEAHTRRNHHVDTLQNRLRHFVRAGTTYLRTIREFEGKEYIILTLHQ